MSGGGNRNWYKERSGKEFPISKYAYVKRVGAGAYAIVHRYFALLQNSCIRERKKIVIRYDLSEGQDSSPEGDLPPTIAVKEIPAGGTHSDSAVRVLTFVQSFPSSNNCGANVQGTSREEFVVENLRHKNVVKIFGKFTVDEGIKGLVMEMCQGSLQDLVKAERVYRLGEISCVGKQLLEGLEFLHGKRITHRYDKVGNLGRQSGKK